MNDKMVKENRKCALIFDSAPCHFVAAENIPDFTNVKIIYIGKLLTDKLQPLDNNYIACIKNIYKRWLNLEIFMTEEIPSKFDKLKKNYRNSLWPSTRNWEILLGRNFVQGK